MTTDTAHRTLPFRLGEPHGFAGLTVLPLFGPPPAFEYVGLDEAVARGLVVGELAGGGAVETVAVENPLAEAVLLYEGELLVGAQQNRIVRRTALVAAGATVEIPVTCVERGRWTPRTPSFSVAPHAAYPALRRLQHATAVQDSSWTEVRAKSDRLGAASPTEAADALYDAHAPAVDEYARDLPRVPGQCGAIALIAGRVSVLDYVSRADVFAGLHAKLLRGYALDALETRAPVPLRRREVARFLAQIDLSGVRLADPVALGTEGRLGGDVFGVELTAFGELVALTAYPRAA
jgi:hypothetical protein